MEYRPTLGYWDIRGLAEPIRYLLRYLGVDYEDRVYSAGPPPDFDDSAWTSGRHNLGLDFPNLPYFIDNDLRLTESSAIIEYLVLKYKPQLGGVSLREKAVIKQLGGVISDVKGYMASSCYHPGFESNRAEVIQNVKYELTVIARFLGNKPFLIGERETWPDFTFFELLEMIEAISPGSLHEVSPNLVPYRNRIAGLDGIRERLTQPRLPWNGAAAYWR